MFPKKPLKICQMPECNLHLYRLLHLRIFVQDVVAAVPRSIRIHMDTTCDRQPHTVYVMV